MLTMLRGVVLEGTGTEAAIPGYTVAGKTGTAAKIESNGRYSTSRYVASFVGLVPATKPRLVIMVMVDEPRGNIYGGVVAAPTSGRSPASTCSIWRWRRTRHVPGSTERECLAPEAANPHGCVGRCQTLSLH